MADNLYSFRPSRAARTARTQVLESAGALLAMLEGSIRESQPDQTPLGVERVPPDSDSEQREREPGGTNGR